MSTDRVRIRDMYLAAVELPPDQRHRYLTEACRGDTELLAEVDRLLATDADPGSVPGPATCATGDATGAFLPGDLRTVNLPARESSTDAFVPDAQRPTGILSEATGPDGATGDFGQPVADATTAKESALPLPVAHRALAGEGIGTVIAGRYTLVKVIGEGGMGSVYLASQTEPVKRHVALKLIKTGMDSQSVLARFDAERQALALMDHPNIARIYDGGLTPAGQPFFVMELVQGVPLTDYCDAKQLSVQARLELFVPVCQAVQHAHQKGIIHRDLKPGNVLVTEVDGRPTPKVIDFGVAKATEVKLTDMSLADVGAIVGTPAYMSPEQADPLSMDIDTRTDVYALGVILYELLVGSPPLEAKDFHRGALLEMLRMVREVDPPRPSTKLSSAKALPNIAANRSIEPARLSRLLQGELDWVVMKALEKDRNRRYDTANGFARDIQRYLADEVVEARPPSRGYRLKKFVKRNRIQVIAASLVFLTLVGGIVGTTWGMREANLARAGEKARADAERDAKLDADVRRQEAERNLAFARKGNEILGSVFAGLDPKQIEESGRPVQDVLRENLVKAVKELDGSAIGDPLEVAAMQTRLGLSLYALGDYDLAVEVLEKSSKTQKARLGVDQFATLDTMVDLAAAYRAAGKLDKALPLFEETLAHLKSTFGPDHPHTLTIMVDLALCYEDAGNPDKALPLLDEALALTKAKLGEAPSLININNMALGFRQANQLDKALPLQEEALVLAKSSLGPNHPNTLATMSNLALAYQAAGKLDKALPLYEEALAIQKAKLAPDHPGTLRSMTSLASYYRDTGKLEKALPLYEEALVLQKARLGANHPDTLATMGALAISYQVVGKLDKALPLFEETLALQKSKLGPNHPNTLASMSNLGTMYWQLKRLDKSVPMFEEVLTLMEKKHGRNHPDTIQVIANLGVNYKDVGQLKKAIPLLEEAYQAEKQIPRMQWVLAPLLDVYTKAGENAKFAELASKQLPEARRTLPANSPALAGLLAQIGMSLLQQKKYDEAEPLLRESLAIRMKTQPEVWNTFNSKSLLGGALMGQKKQAEAEPLLLAGYEGMKQREAMIPPEALSRVQEALDRLIECYTATNKPEQVKKYQAERAKSPEADPGKKK